MPEKPEQLHEWFDPSWFDPGTLRSFHWEHPEYLYFIPLIPLLFFLRPLLARRTSWGTAFFPNDKVRDASTWLRFIPSLLLGLALALMLTALGRPQRTSEKVERWTEGIDIMIILDVSKSMTEKDFHPNRLEAAKNVARRFIDGRKDDRIGLVIYAGEAYALSPLTTDYEMLTSFIEDINFNMIQARGTAIGTALGVCINHMKTTDTKSKVAILLSDGENNQGNLDPITAANMAHAFDIKLYTIGIGSKRRNLRHHLNEKALRRIADIGKGSYFRATDNQALHNIFQKIDQYEKAEIKENRYKNTSDFYPVYLLWGMAFLLLWLLSKSTFMANALED